MGRRLKNLRRFAVHIAQTMRAANGLRAGQASQSWQAMLRAGAACLTLAGPFTAAALANPDDLPLVPSRQYAFRIPFTVDGIAAGAPYAAEVQLHVSEDRGATWRLAGRVGPEQREFKFQAPHDGEYWFLVRTRDAKGQLRPEGAPAPQMRVLVDTQPPQISIKAKRGVTGEVVANLRAIDAHLRIESAKLLYQATNGEWRNVAVEPLVRDAAAGPGPEAYSSETRFWANDLAPGSMLRIEFRDTVGNLTVEQSPIEIQSPPPVANVAAPVTPSIGATAPPMQPAAEVLPAPKGELPAAPTFTSTSMSRPIEERSTLPVRTVPAQSVPTQPSTTAPTSPAPNSTPPTSTSPAVMPVLPKTPPVSAQPAKQPEPEVVAKPQPLSPAVTSNASTNTTVMKPAIENSSPTYVASTSSPRQDNTPAGVQPRMVNSHRFELEYDVISASSDGLAKVELWKTADGGRTWSAAGVDEDRRSPHVVGVSEDGLYGFRMVIETGTGLRNAEPRAGDLPDVWVGVDTHAPSAEIVRVEPAAVDKPTQMLIQWQASDDRLAAQPVSLSFAEQPSGPWSTIASGLKNTGSYEWRVDSRVPLRVFLRLEVRDQAGNTATAISREPVSLEHLRPRSKILNVRPVASDS